MPVIQYLNQPCTFLVSVALAGDCLCSAYEFRVDLVKKLTAEGMNVC